MGQDHDAASITSSQVSPKNTSYDTRKSMRANREPIPLVLPSSAQPPPLPPGSIILPPLTFGIEFELTATSQTPAPELRNLSRAGKIHLLWQEIKSELEDAGLPAKIEGDRPAKFPVSGMGKDGIDDNSDDSSATITFRSNVKGNHDYDHRWSIGHDSSIISEESLLPVEIGSPPYYYCPASLDAVKLFCDTITARFRTNVNSSCGLHVHVGNGTAGFPFRAIRNLIALIWVFEPQLDQLHPNRTWSREDRGTAYYASLRHSTPLSYGAWIEDISPKDFLDEDPLEQDVVRPTVMEGLATIMGTQDINTLDSLVAGLKGTHKEAYMIVNLTEPGEPFKRTIEFRQHEGTLNGERAMEWIKTVVELVEFARDTDSVPFLSLLTAHARNEDRSGYTRIMDVIELFEVLGMTERARAWDAIIPADVRKRPTSYRNKVRDYEGKFRDTQIEHYRREARERPDQSNKQNLGGYSISEVEREMAAEFKGLDDDDLND